MQYHTNEIRFLLPGDWLDRTINAFVLPDGPPGTTPRPDAPGQMSIVITRDTLPVGSTFASYAGRVLDAMRTGLEDFRLLDRRRLTVDDHAAEQVEYLWMKDGRLMHQSQTWLDGGDVVLTITGTADDRGFAKHQGALKQLLSTIKFNG